MSYLRYFKPEQQLLLRVIDDNHQQERMEVMTGYIVSIERDTLIISLPYGSDTVGQYPFQDEMAFEITSEALGMGVRTHGHITKKITGNKIAIKLDSELQVFQRRISSRLDWQLGIRFSRAAKTLQAMRQIWEKNLAILTSSEAPLIFDGFKSAHINISSGGLRLVIKPPATQGELCLILINLDDGKPPVCAIAEIVWSCAKNETAIIAGMRFTNILSEDQQRIENFITKNKST